MRTVPWETDTKKSLRFFLLFSAALVAFAAVLVVTAFLGVGWLNDPPARSRNLAAADYVPDGEALGEGIVTKNGAIRVTVSEDESARSVGRRLRDAGLIKNADFWYYLSRFDKKILREGVFTVDFGAKTTDIRRDLTTQSGQTLVSVTIPEGVTLRRMADILEKAGICGKAAFLTACADRELLAKYQIPGKDFAGYLYPDTYCFPLGYPAERVVITMADTFFKKIERLMQGKRLLPKALNEKVIIASIVEREYRASDEAPLIAGVFYNRLKINMPLQSCATVVYVITDIEGKPHPNRIFFTDTAIKNPYNTYVNAGLPPGPISEPGFTALRAAFYPKHSDYLYFRLVDPKEGRHHFSKTLNEHNAAAALYVKDQ